MRKYLVLLILSIFLGGMTYYLLNTLNPLDTEKIEELTQLEGVYTRSELVSLLQELGSRGLLADYLNLRNVSLILVTGLIALGTGITFIHMLIERTFFRKFYQQPNIARAVRRAILVVLGTLSMLFYLLYAADWYLIILTWVLLLLIEVLITKTLQRNSSVRPDEKLPEKD